MDDGLTIRFSFRRWHLVVSDGCIESSLPERKLVAPHPKVNRAVDFTKCFIRARQVSSRVSRARKLFLTTLVTKRATSTLEGIRHAQHPEPMINECATDLDHEYTRSNCMCPRSARCKIYQRE